MIIPTPVNNAGPPDKWADASFYDVTLVQLASALIASGKYAPGQLLMELAISGTTQIMIQTGRWNGADLAPMSLDEAIRKFIRWHGVGTK